jgi:hypothetical protein
MGERVFGLIVLDITLGPYRLPLLMVWRKAFTWAHSFSSVGSFPGEHWFGKLAWLL